MHTRFGWILVLVLWAAHPALAKDNGTVVAGALGERLDMAVESLPGDEFWGAVLVARGGEVLLAKGYGMADYKETPNTPQTLFEIASASKQFTAAAILRLEQQGKLKTTDTLDAFFPGIPADKKDIQVHHLLTHTSGLSNDLGVPYRSTIGRKAYIRQMLAPARVAEPGTTWAYNNAAYAILAAIVEVASGQSFEVYMRKEVFAPAGLKDTGLIQDKRLLATKRAATRRADGINDRTAVDWNWGWGYRGMGGVVTTIYDLLKWHQVLTGEKVLGPEAKRKFYAPFKNGYAYGWFVRPSGHGTTHVFHGGGVRGFGCYYVRDLDEDVVIAILTNNRRDLHLLRERIENLLWKPPSLVAKLDASPYELTKYRAAELADGLVWRVEKKGAVISIELHQEEHVPLRLQIPKGYASKIIAGLESGIDARKQDDKGGEATMEGGLYLNAYRSEGKRFELTEGLSVNILPQYVGRGEGGERIVDKRVVFVLQDSKRRNWPVMVKMNVAAARTLLEALR